MKYFKYYYKYLTLFYCFFKFLSFSIVILLKKKLTYVEFWDGARLIFSSATYPDQLQRIAESIVDYEYLYCVKTENLHRIMPHIKQTFIRIRETDKLEKVKELLERGLSFPSGQTLIFCKVRFQRFIIFFSLNIFATQTSNLLFSNKPIFITSHFYTSSLRSIQ